LARTLGADVPAELVFPAHAASASASPDDDASPKRRSRSLDASPPQPQREAEAAAEAHDAHTWVTGNGLWTGEWNRRDIKEVQQQLRTLRLR
ncbi:hypothetical protein WOLCODRAFT_151928, partial [Wolfiporia cocos MD-104 SS10]